MMKGVGVFFFATKFYFTESQGFARYSPKYTKYSVCGIKPDTKMISLHIIEVLKISFFPQNKYAVHNF